MLKLNERGARTTILGVMLAAALGGFALSGHSTADETADNLAAYYGFGRLELYKLQQRSGNMLAADLNNDGRTDLILIDNSNSRPHILQQRAKSEAPAKPEVTAKTAGANKVNAVESDKRLEHKKVAV